MVISQERIASFSLKRKDGNPWWGPPDCQWMLGSIIPSFWVQISSHLHKDLNLISFPPTSHTILRPLASTCVWAPFFGAPLLPLECPLLSDLGSDHLYLPQDCQELEDSPDRRVAPIPEVAPSSSMGRISCLGCVLFVCLRLCSP